MQFVHVLLAGYTALTIKGGRHGHPPHGGNSESRVNLRLGTRADRYFESSHLYPVAPHHWLQPWDSCEELCHLQTLFPLSEIPKSPSKPVGRYQELRIKSSISIWEGKITVVYLLLLTAIHLALGMSISVSLTWSIYSPAWTTYCYISSIMKNTL